MTKVHLHSIPKDPKGEGSEWQNQPSLLVSYWGWRSSWQAPGTCRRINTSCDTTTVVPLPEPFDTEKRRFSSIGWGRTCPYTCPYTLLGSHFGDFRVGQKSPFQRLMRLIWDWWKWKRGHLNSHCQVIMRSEERSYHQKSDMGGEGSGLGWIRCIGWNLLVTLTWCWLF